MRFRRTQNDFGDFQVWPLIRGQSVDVGSNGLGKARVPDSGFSQPLEGREGGEEEAGFQPCAFA